MTHLLDYTVASRKNNLNALRVLLTLMVIVSHCFPLTGNEEPFSILSHQQASIGTIAVDAFFFISGILITASWLNSRSMNDYLRRRVLRIVPGYLVCLVISFFVAVAFSSNPLGRVRPRAWHFMLDFFSLGMDSIAGKWVFPSNPYPGTANGSLWTIKREFFCYLVVAAVGLFGQFKYRRRLAIVFAVVFAFYCLSLIKGDEVFQLDRRFFVFFAAGVSAWLWRDKIPIHGGIALAALGVMIVSIFIPPLFAALNPFLLCYLLLWVGFAHPVKAFQWFDRTDLSYGLYLFAFLVQQTVAACGLGQTPLSMLLISLPIVLGIAWLSWTFVEKKFLSLKSKEFKDWDPALPQKAIATDKSTPIIVEAQRSW